MIVAEHAAGRRQRLASPSPTSPSGLAAILAEYPDALLVGRKRDRSYAALLPADGGNVFVDEATWTARGRPRAGKQWLLPGNHWKAWRVLHTSDRWAAWDHGATLGQWLTGPELAETIAAAVAQGHAGVERGGD
jgi:hypothetical protein